MHYYPLLLSEFKFMSGLHGPLADLVSWNLVLCKTRTCANLEEDGIAQLLAPRSAAAKMQQGHKKY